MVKSLLKIGGVTDLNTENQTPILKTQIHSCTACGAMFIFRRFEQERFAQYGWTTPKRCPICRRAAKARRREAQERQENQRWQQEKAKEQKEFELRLRDWNVVPLGEIQPGNDRVLYILGNGFDLMHGVRSSYYAFRDSLGKRSALRNALENFLTLDDIWADFENALAHFNIKAMCSRFAVDDWLDMFDAYKEDAGASDFFLAVESAAAPILTVVNELPQHFRKWVETLAIGTEDRPLRKMFQKGKVLCFNYTEFVETLYGIPEAHVCYIHGCRRKKKYHPQQGLILGHMPGASDEAFDFNDDSFLRIRDPRKRYLMEAAQAQVIRLVAESDQMLTKDCREVIDIHKSFFENLAQTETVLVIGHSLSPVDWDYFSEVASRLSGKNHVQWYFGCHGLHDLEHLEQLLAELDIERSSVSVFRTDQIAVTPLKQETAPAKIWPSAKTRCVSPDGRWAVKTLDGMLWIDDLEHHQTDCEIMFSTPVSGAFFTPSGECLFGILRGVDSGIFLFRIVEGHWVFIDELESFQNQSLINPRLNHIFLTSQEIMFVYNNRVRKYTLADGRLVSNQSLRSARNASFSGDDITHLFSRKQKVNHAQSEQTLGSCLD